ncbi:MAG TPA: DUF1800 domain-containing protein [Burkholderiaceae bacterium]|nr:DUF1800 domain-containing protein [Burkholderiaceae bacterium]
MPASRPRRFPPLPAVLAALLVASCAPVSPQVPPQVGLPAAAPLATSLERADPVALLDRISWGATPSAAAHVRAVGNARYLAEQLRPYPEAPLPPAVARQIDAMTISTTPVARLAVDLERRMREARALPDEAARQDAVRAVQAEYERIGREAQARHLLRALYSPAQLQEQMTWFWLNHFSVFRHKHNLRVLVADYDDALRQHALGRFRDLLAASIHHPAMLRYLDNENNAAGHGNENYARELLELHTLGVDGGYTQADVQALARVLTGLGVRLDDPAGAPPPRLRREHAAEYVRDGLFEFNPNRHDYQDKVLLGTTIRGRGLAEVDQVVDLLSRHPATARFVSRKLATYFIGDDPAPALVERMANAFRGSDGDIPTVLRALFTSPQFAASLEHEFKDPMHYVVSAVRLAYDERPILNPKPMVNWLNRLGEGLYDHTTPDGYPMGAASWNGPGQMTTRFEIARALGNGSAGLFRGEEAGADQPAFPQLANPVYYDSLRRRLAPGTQQALEQATSPQEWNGFLLSSPEFMYR